MKKILIITPHLSTGGLPQFLLEKINILINQYDVYLIEWEDITGGVFVVQRRKLVELLKDKLFTLHANKREVFDIIDRINPDIIHFEEFSETFIDYNILDDIYSDRSYYITETTHGTSFNPEDKAYIPDKMMFVSKGNFNQYRKITKDCDVIEFPINHKKRSENLLKLGLDPTFKHVLNVGLFTPGKNQSEIFELAKRLTKYKIKFHFVGNQAGNFQDYWKPLMNDKPDNCIVWGEKDNVSDFYSAMDLFLYTSKWENRPLSVLEAIDNKMQILMYNLPNYADDFTRFENVDFLTNDANSNINLILEKLELNHTEGGLKIVQVGACRGNDHVSNLILGKKVSQLILVEANPINIEELNQFYKYQNCEILNLAIGLNNQESVKIYYSTHDSPNYEISSLVKEHVIKHNYPEDSIRHHEVKCITLDELLDSKNAKSLDYLFLDIEGLDAEISLNFNPSKYDIKNIQIETLHLGEKRDLVINHFKKHGYEMKPGLDLHGYDNLFVKSDVVDTKTSDLRYSESMNRNISAYHILTDIDTEREIRSVADLSQLENYGIKYNTIISKRYTELPPKETCAFPDLISFEPGGKLTPAHYGCYLGHRKAFETGYKDNPDYMIIFECDCILDVSHQMFLEKVEEAINLIEKHDLFMFSLGYHNNQSIMSKHENFYKVYDFIGAHAYIIPRKSYDLLYKTYQTAKWNVADLWLGNNFCHLTQGIFPKPITKQAGGISILENLINEDRY